MSFETVLLIALAAAQIFQLGMKYQIKLIEKKAFKMLGKQSKGFMAKSFFDKLDEDKGNW